MRTARLPVSWADISVMPPSPRRDELIYAYRTQVLARRIAADHDAVEAARTRQDAETERVRALVNHGDTPALCAHRLLILDHASRIKRSTA